MECKDEIKEFVHIDEIKDNEVDSIGKTTLSLMLTGTFALIDTGKKLADIKHSLLYHYTSIEALFNGILVKNNIQENKEVSLMATDSEFLNDPTEIELGAKVLSILPEINRYFRFGDSDSEHIKKRFKHCCIISFSRSMDSLPMWSLYGKKGDGISLGFDIDVIMKSGVCVFPCFYDVKILKKFIKAIRKLSEDERIPDDAKCNSLPRKAFQDTLLYIILSRLIKDPAFEYEKEYRHIALGDDSVNFRYANNMIIPYKMVYLPKDALRQIIIGPNLEPERTKKSVQAYLAHLGFEHVEVKISDVPYRNL